MKVTYHTQFVCLARFNVSRHTRGAEERPQSPAAYVGA